MKAGRAPSPYNDALCVTPLMEAARDGAYERLLQCLQTGPAAINAVDAAGRNALAYALEAQQETIATVLLNRGIDGTHASGDGTTPLMLACKHQVPEIVQRLLQKKVSLDAQNKQGNTALIFACAAGDGWSACQLLEAGADGNLKNNEGRSALTLARDTMSPRDLGLFQDCLSKCIEARQAQKEHHLAQQVQEATILQRDMKPLKPVAFRPKAL